MISIWNCYFLRIENIFVLNEKVYHFKNTIIIRLLCLKTVETNIRITSKFWYQNLI